MADVADVRLLRWLQATMKVAGPLVTMAVAARIAGISMPAVHKAVRAEKLRLFRWSQGPCPVKLVSLRDVVEWNKHREDYSSGECRYHALMIASRRKRLKGQKKRGRPIGSVRPTIDDLIVSQEDEARIAKVTTSKAEPKLSSKRTVPKKRL